MNLSVREILNACGGTLLCGNPDAEVTGVKVDSREVIPGDLFVPIKGERIDPHLYIDAVFEAGAAASFTENPKEPLRSGALIYVEQTLPALQKLAAAYRAQFSIPLVGITGSVGKTTTKEMVALALSAGKRVMSTKGNQNSQIGLPLTMFQLAPEDEAAVIEMGMSEFGEMSRLAAVAAPTLAVMTNIGLSHIGQLHTQENILHEKLHITDGWGPGNILFLNGDDPLLAPLHGHLPFQTVTYGTGETCIWRACGIVPYGDGLSFHILYPGGIVHVDLPVPGMHHILNAAAAVAVAAACGISPQAAAAALSRYTPPAMRQQIHHAGDITIIDDTYNASPDSVRGGIDVLCGLKTPGKRIALLADMRELGEHSREAHESVGAYAAQRGVDLVITIGEESLATAQAAQAGGISCHCCKENTEAAELLLSLLKPGDAVLVKGSRGMHTETVVKTLLQKL